MTSVVIGLNGVLIAGAASDRSYGALAIAFFIGPITNGVLLLLAAAFIPIVKSRARGASVGIYLAASIGLPLAAIPIDFLMVFAMDLHGC